MKEVELVLTQASEAEFKKVKVSMEELKKSIVESIKAKNVEKLRGPGNIFYITKPLKDGVLYLEFTPIGENVFKFLSLAKRDVTWKT